MADGGTARALRPATSMRELHALQSWYVALGYAIVNRRRVPPPHIRDTRGPEQAPRPACEQAALGDEPRRPTAAALMLLWASQHLDSLWRLEAHLGERANALEDGLGRSAFGRAALGRARLAARRRYGADRREPSGAREAADASPDRRGRGRSHLPIPTVSAGTRALRRTPPAAFALDRPLPAGPDQDADPEEDDRKQDHRRSVHIARARFRAVPTPRTSRARTANGEFPATDPAGRPPGRPQPDVKKSTAVAGLPGSAAHVDVDETSVA